MATTSVGLSQRIAPGPLRPSSRSGSSGEVQELVSHLYQRNRKRPARRVSALPPLFSVGEGKCSSLGGLIALFALLAHHFFSCSVTGKPLAATTHVGVTKMHALTAVKCKKLEAQDAVLGCVQGEISSLGTNYGCDLFPGLASWATSGYGPGTWLTD